MGDMNESLSLFSRVVPACDVLAHGMGLLVCNAFLSRGWPGLTKYLRTRNINIINFPDVDIYDGT